VWWHAAATSKIIAVFHYGVRHILIQFQVLAVKLYRLSQSLGTPRFDLALRSSSFDQRQKMVVLRTASLPYATA
jgi:hypothetical protein